VDSHVREILGFLYGESDGSAAATRLERMLARQSRGLRPPRCAPDLSSPSLTEKDAILICYADHLTEPGVPPLRSLKRFLAERLARDVSGVHILPFFPSSSDEGFSIIDYRRVDPRLGDWGDVRSIAGDFRLMVDLVLNHVSARSAWFRGFLRGHRRLARYFMTVQDGTDLGSVFRPRTHPLLTEFRTRRGLQKVWTTFSADQVDLNYRNPEVLLQIIEVLLFYVRQGAQIIRLDAVAFIWKEPGTPCVHLPQTHAVVRLLRAIVKEICPWVVLLTETNVPHELNVSYLGSGTDEAHMIYNFSLPPLVLDALYTGETDALSAWAAGMKAPFAGRFLNFLSSHDGIGLIPARGYLPEARILDLVDHVRANGGFVSMRSEQRGQGEAQTPYELNIPWLDAVSSGDEEEETRLLKLTTSHCAMFCLAGVPALYINSLLAVGPDREEALRSGSPRAINRKRLDARALRSSLAVGRSFGARAMHALARCLSARRSSPAFHPAGAQEILTIRPGLFSVLRTSPDGKARVFCIHNFSPRAETFVLDARTAGAQPGRPIKDILSGATMSVRWAADSLPEISLRGYESVWISP
jgi:hypothetical protein